MLEEIPGYRAALAAEREARDYAFLGLPTAICGIYVVQLTLRQLMARLAIRCPFIADLPAEKIMQLPDPAGEIAAFIWHVSIARARSRGNPLAEYRARQVFYARLAFISAEDAIAGIQEYLKITFMDSPASGGKEYVPTASIAATLVDIFAAEYGWTRDEILDAPLVQLYQLLRERARTLNPKAILFNRLSDKVRGDYLASINEAAEQSRVEGTASPLVESNTAAPLSAVAPLDAKEDDTAAPDVPSSQLSTNDSQLSPPQ